MYRDLYTYMYIYTVDAELDGDRANHQRNFDSCQIVKPNKNLMWANRLA